jgi:diguanylate cyclase (GGDEF)-like protein
MSAAKSDAIYDVAPDEQPVLLSSLPAGRVEYRLVAAIVVVSTLVFMVLAPLAGTQLAVLPAFIPIYQSAQLINDLITAIFLLGQRQFARSSALGVLAGGYLFAGLVSTAHMMTFPGLFTPTGLLGAGPQTTAWLYMFWHGGFPLFVIVYAIGIFDGARSRSGTAVFLCVFGSVLVLAGGVTLFVTRGQAFLPAIMQGNRYTPAMIVVVSGVWFLNLIALSAVSRRRPYRVLDVWLMVTMYACLLDIALSAVLNGGRYDLGFYAGRIYGLMASSFVLVVLLVHNAALYLQVVTLRESDHVKAVELQRLSTVDALTGIANRRAFDEALGREWRRMMRHGTALSLLLIDVDYFKRFNDTYGHVAGDGCLRTVAQALGRRARRAGELAARYGGEEFAVLLPHTGSDDARRLAELMCTSVRELALAHAGSAVAPFVTVSIGVASVADLPETAAALCRDGPATLPPPAATVLVEAADQALYRAKTGGRNRVAVAGSDAIEPVAA